MITPEEFRARWVAAAGEESFVRFKRTMFDGLSLPKEGVGFLLAVGLPESAAPFLSTDHPSRSQLATAAQAWHLPEPFARFRVLGADGAGSPLCIEEESGQLIILDHDNSFAAQLVNSSIPQFAESLVVYQEFVKAVIAANGEDAWLDNVIPARLRARLAESLESIDARAITPGSFWGEELSRLR